MMFSVSTDQSSGESPAIFLSEDAAVGVAFCGEGGGGEGAGGDGADGEGVGGDRLVPVLQPGQRRLHHLVPTIHLGSRCFRLLRQREGRGGASEVWG